ncbi:MAG: (d)CMP kinase [Deltaproteobacteria bacterium]|nr:(d)CMP kinase [Deltaproteobacteria bacterium]
MGKRAIITIDGPAGAGKSTVGRRLAQSLDYLYLDSGSLYRAVAWQSLRRGLDLDDPGVMGEFLPSFKPEIKADGAGFHLFIDGREVREEIRTPEVSRGASMVAKLPMVRRWVKEHLRWLARNGGVVADGRDQGTAVFPEAGFKFYLDAALRTRALRRLQDWRQNNDPPSLEEVMRDVEARDRQDETRDEAPLKVPPGAVVVDTTDLNVEQVVERCLAEIRSLG